MPLGFLLPTGIGRISGGGMIALVVLFFRELSGSGFIFLFFDFWALVQLSAI
jgi:Na+-transporting NADH:ubiquinone oxidoreductase subunit NqrD